MKNNSVVLRTLPATAFALILAFWLGSCKKEAFDPALTRDLTIHSTINGANYNIKVALPAGYDSSGERYASVYVLDGEQNFDLVSNTSREISEELAVPNAVVISIGYGRDRSIDYTPTKVSDVTGCGLEFLNFIETELIPAIEENFRVDTTRNSRVILGHSYGGLFGAYAFCIKNQLFGNYILLSPSLWFDDLITLQYEQDNREENRDRDQLVFMGIGEAENSGRMQAPFEAFLQILQDNYPQIKLGKNREEDLGHMGSKDANIVKGLNHYFRNR